MDNDDLRRAQILTRNLLTILLSLDEETRDKIVGKIIRGTCMIGAIKKLQDTVQTSTDRLTRAANALNTLIKE